MNMNIFNGFTVWLGFILIAIEAPWFWAVVIPLNLVLACPQWFFKEKPPSPKE